MVIIGQLGGQSTLDRILATCDTVACNEPVYDILWSEQEWNESTCHKTRVINIIYYISNWYWIEYAYDLPCDKSPLSIVIYSFILAKDGW